MKIKLFVSILILFFLGGCATGDLHDTSDTDYPNLDYRICPGKFEDINQENGTRMVVNYPQVFGLADGNREKVINTLIEVEAIDGHWWNGQNRGRSLDVDYEIAFASERILSVKFSGSTYIKGDAHPNNEYYCLNIDLKNGEILTINDLLQRFDMFNSDQFVLTKYMISEEGEGPPSKEITDELLKEYVYSNSNFFFTPERFGILIFIGGAEGERLEFEAPYTALEDCINWDNPVWQSILPRK